VLVDRCHERIVANPTQCRHTLVYVLANVRHHGAAHAAGCAHDRVASYSSSSAFDG